MQNDGFHCDIFIHSTYLTSVHSSPPPLTHPLPHFPWSSLKIMDGSSWASLAMDKR